MTATITYLKGDATQPQYEGNSIIVHICNDIGGWGRGFVGALSRRWKQPERQYREWHKSGHNFALGQVQLVRVEDSIWVANVIGQRDIKPDTEGVPPIRYEAVRTGLQQVRSFARELDATLHMPRIGCGLAGGSWDRIEPLITEEVTRHGIDTWVYDL